MQQGGLASLAQNLASKGRYGDTMLAHINPQEAAVLKAMGGSGTINPRTGLREYFSLFPKKGISLNFGPLGKVKVGRKSSDLLLAAGAGYAGATGFMGLNPATAAIGYGGIRALATGNLQEGIMAGLSAYGMGEGFQAAGVGGTAAPTGPAPIETRSVGAEFGGGVGPSTAAPTANVAGLESIPSTVPSATGADMGFNVGSAPGAGFQLPAGESSFAFDPVTGDQLVTGMEGVAPAGTGTMRTVAQPVYGQNVGVNAAATPAAPDGFLARNLPASVQEYVPNALLDASGTTLAGGALLGSSLVAGQQERQAFERQQAALRAEEEEKQRRYRELFESTLGRVPTRMARSGGLMSLAKGGMTYMEAGGTTGPTGVPRDVSGTGDGMSDSVPATIEGVQEARLADGEFVIPADVVSDIGNGSSDAGSKKLYDMMDRIRKARHGTTKQPPEINAEKLMPA